MARPKHNNPAEFVGSELEAATGLSKRNIQFLRDRGVGPFDGADFKSGKYTEDQMAFLAIIAAINGGAIPLLQSAEIAEVFLEDKANHPIGRFGHTDQLTDKHPHWAHVDRPEQWFHAHSLMRLENASYESGQILDDDITILVADNNHVAEGVLVERRIGMLMPKGADPHGPTPMGRLKEGVEGHFTPIYNEMTFDGGPEDATAYIQYQEAVKMACSLLRVNVSLAIRKAFDATHDVRVEKGGPFFA